MREHLGEEFGGTVSAVTSFGLFVTLDGLYVEGLVHITELGGEYFRFDEVRQELRGERSGLRYVVGSRVRVQVSRVDLDGRKIDFRMVRDGEDVVAMPSRARRERSNDKAASAAERTRRREGRGPRGAQGDQAEVARQLRARAAPGACAEVGDAQDRRARRRQGGRAALTAQAAPSPAFLIARCGGLAIFFDATME